jgi:hypothetical protein
MGFVLLALGAAGLLFGTWVMYRPESLGRFLNLGGQFTPAQLRRMARQRAALAIAFGVVLLVAVFLSR